MHPLDFTGNISENWARWKEIMELVLAGPSANKWTETQKAAQFLMCIGQQGRDMARAWVSSSELSEDDKKSPSELFAIFETHCAPRKNVTIQRKLFYERKQSTGEKIDEWITQLRLIATDCEFHNQDEMIRDMIVLNSVNKKGARTVTRNRLPRSVKSIEDRQNSSDEYRADEADIKH